MLVVTSTVGPGFTIRRVSKRPVRLPKPTAATEFTGYEHLEEHTTVTGISEQDGRTIVKLAESPFYAEGGGQVTDEGELIHDSYWSERRNNYKNFGSLLLAKTTPPS